MLTLGLLLATTAGCGTATEDAASRSPEGAASRESDRAASCPARMPAKYPLPNTRPELEKLDYWLGLASAEALDAPLLDAEQLRAHDLALRGLTVDGRPRSVDLTRTPSHEELVGQLVERLAAFSERFGSGEYTTARDRERHAQALRADPKAGFVEARALHVALDAIPMYCAPFVEPIRSTTGNPRFDRNRCSAARAQEPIEILGSYGPELRVARTRNAWGFITRDAKLSPPVPAELDATYRRGPELALLASLSVDSARIPAGVLVPSAGPAKPAAPARGKPHAEAPSKPMVGWIANAEGFTRSPSLSTQQALATERALTRRTFLQEAFSYIAQPYGWGDENGGRDCSRFVLDVLARFGLHLPRTSGEQGKAGIYNVEIPAEASEVERLALLDESQRRGVVLVHLPGHIMIYLGRDREGVPRVLHSFAEYLAPCAKGGETLFEVGRVSVTDLSLGKGTSRRAFLERITRLSVLGAPPGHALLALSSFRRAVPPAEVAPVECNDSLDAALFRSPRAPHAKAPMRVIAVTTQESRPAGLWLVDPQGQLLSPEVHELGVGPFARWAEVSAPAPGRWTALLADGERVLACEHFRVRPTPAAPPDRPSPTQAIRPPERGGAGATLASAALTPGLLPGAEVAEPLGAPAWEAPLAWERDTEHLYAAFVEQLFSQPLDDLGSWPALTPLISSPSYNLLYNHLGLDEDKQLNLSPDCADLPYFLRGYFAWKLGLPFAFRQCSRGHAGVPPHCGDIVTNETPIAADDPVSAFSSFIRAHVGSGVHSASARTLPSDEAADLYPLPLTREALTPGSVFADPYGHTIMVAKWVPQGLAGAGMLIGADAQPDATVARRRFWRGNFLFSPDTHDVGAGFKAFRPIVRDLKSRALAALDSRALAASREFPAPSMQQYQGGQADFYARMDELMYPRPIAVGDRMRQLVDALNEQVLRRVEAVDLGEAAVRQRREPIPMPEGYAIFETSGPWEDFATPSRDMRLLIALDAVRGFPDAVRARPERFGASSADAQRLGSEVAEQLTRLLRERRFRYTRSDGSTFELTLADVMARGAELEVAYDPNDCVETRWGAAPASDEASTCKRSAPAGQRALLEQYRAWFHARARPPRP